VNSTKLSLFRLRAPEKPLHPQKKGPQALSFPPLISSASCCF
jgi:hypothetical protein